MRDIAAEIVHAIESKRDDCPFCLGACSELVEYDGEEMCPDCRDQFYYKDLQYEEELWEMSKAMELEEWEAEQKQTQIRVEEEMW